MENFTFAFYAVWCCSMTCCAHIWRSLSVCLYPFYAHIWDCQDGQCSCGWHNEVLSLCARQIIFFLGFLHKMIILRSANLAWRRSVLWGALHFSSNATWPRLSFWPRNTYSIKWDTLVVMTIEEIKYHINVITCRAVRNHNHHTRIWFFILIQQGQVGQ